MILHSTCIFLDILNSHIIHQKMKPSLLLKMNDLMMMKMNEKNDERIRVISNIIYCRVTVPKWINFLVYLAIGVKFFNLIN